MPTRSNGRPFTARHKQIAGLICEGKSNKQIGWQLHLTEGTVKVYISEMFVRSGTANRAGLAAWWVRRCDISNK